MTPQKNPQTSGWLKTFRNLAKSAPGRSTHRRRNVCCLLLALVACSCPSQARPLPRTAVEVRAAVKGVEGTRVSLDGGWQNGLTQGMVLNLLDVKGAVVGQTRLTSVGARSAQGERLGDGNRSTAPVEAIAPYPAAITRVEGYRVSFLLPHGNRQLRVGDTLTIVRDAEPIATATFHSYQPVSAILMRVKPGASVRTSDLCWVYEAPEATQFIGVGAAAGATATARHVLPVPPRAAANATTPVASVTPPAPVDLPAPIAPDTAMTATAASRRENRAGSGTLSRSGATGLIRMPSATVTADGDFKIAVYGTKGATDFTRVGNTSASALSVGFLPKFELGFALGNERQSRDLSFNAKLQLLRETSRWPALAVGGAELKKTGRSGTNDLYYAVASKNVFNGAVNVTSGLQRTDTRGTKPYGGIEVGLTRGLSAVVEHDSIDVNYGVRASFFRDRAQLSAQHLNDHWTMHVGVRLPLNLRNKPPGAVDLPHFGNQAGGPAAVAKAVQTHLISLGLENVAVRLLGAAGATTAQRLEVAYENRSFPLDEVDALANVLATAAVYAPEGITDLAVVIKRAAIPVLYVSCPVEQYRRFMAGQIDGNTFAPSFLADSQAQQDVSSLTVLANTGIGASSYGHADIIIRPRLTTQVGTELYQLGIGLDAETELDLPVARGVNLNARAVLAGVGPLRSFEDQTYDRLAVEVATKVGPVLARGFAGRFPATTFLEFGRLARRDGVLAEAVWLPGAGRWTARGVAGRTKRDDNVPLANRTTTTYLGEGRYYYPGLDLSVRLVGGRFVDGDNGYKLGVLRRFGDTEFGLEYRDVTGGLAQRFVGPGFQRSRVAVVRLNVPIGPSYISWKPGTVRLRPPDFLDYNQRSLLTRPNYVGPARLAGNELAVAGDISRSLLDRDRLRRPYLLRSLSELRKIRSVGAGPIENRGSTGQ